MEKRNMAEKLNYEIGDVVKLKKPHPCGSQEWEILRVGASTVTTVIVSAKA